MPKALDTPVKVAPIKRVVFVTDDDMGQYLADMAFQHKMKVTSVVRDLLVIGRYCKDMGDMKYDIFTLKLALSGGQKGPS